MSRFDLCVAFVLEHETEYNRDGSVKVERDPADPGGTTKYGIDQRSHPHIDVAGLTLDQAKQIYHEDEWTKCRCADLPAGWDLAVFDAAVNLGKGWAIPALQRLAAVTADGFIGPKTIAAVTALSRIALERYIDLRDEHYRSLRLALRQKYLKGWLARTADLRKAIAV
jgi:lysozyme family protein